MPKDITTTQFQYIHCQREEIEKHESGFDESEFREQLTMALKDDLQIQSIYVTLTERAGQSTDNYSCHIEVKGPRIDISITEKGQKAAPTTKIAVDKTVKLVHKEKDKLRPHP